jgi:hypothetical protein
MAYNAKFCKNQSTSIVISLNFPHYFSNNSLDFFIFLIYMVFQFLDFRNSFVFILLGNWCIIS